MPTDATECVKVSVRCRPMNTKEKQLNCNKIITVDNTINQIILHKPDSKKDVTTLDDKIDKQFTFDSVFDDDSKQSDVYSLTAYELVKSVLTGYNGTIFAYGQTGCGKTFTMEGVRNTNNPELRGIIPTTFTQIFQAIENTSEQSNNNIQYLVRVSYIEIYNEEVRDLMSDNPKARLEIKEDTDKGIYIKNLIQTTVTTVSQIHSIMDAGNKQRSVGATLMNADSSRSHSIFTITIEQSELDPDTQETRIRVGKLNLVDLAGSERQSKTQATGVRLKEATKINLSLSALGNVISALVSNAQGKGVHIPYRDSKLTRLLQDSLGGNTKTCMIAAISPADYNYDETLSTLRYANRAKNIRNKPVINEDPKDALLREYQDEISRLKAMLQQQGIDLQNSNARPQSSINNNNTQILSPKTIQPTADTSLLLSPEEQHLLQEQRVDVQNEIQRIALEKLKHEQLVEQLNVQLSQDAYEVQRLHNVQQEITQQLAVERQNNNTSNIDALTQQYNQLTLEQHTIQELTARIELEKQRHEQLSLDLAAEMDVKLAAEQQIQLQLQQQLADLSGKTYEEKQLLKAKLMKLQQKVMHGGQKIVELQAEHTQQLNMKEIESKALQNAKLAAEAEKLRLENEKQMLNEQYTSKQAEITALQSKLTKFSQKYTALKQDLEEYTVEWNHEKDSYLSNIRDIYRELRLYKLITETLLSKTDVDTIVKNSIYDEDSEIWQIPKINIPVLFPTIGTVRGTTAQPKTSTVQNNGADRNWKRSVVAQSNDAINRYSNSTLPTTNYQSQPVYRTATPSTVSPPIVNAQPVDVQAVTAELPKRAAFTPQPVDMYPEPAAPRPSMIENIDVKARPAFAPAPSALNNTDDTGRQNSTDKPLSFNEPPRRSNFAPATTTLNAANRPATATKPLANTDILNIDVPTRKAFTPAVNTLKSPDGAATTRNTTTNDILSKLPAARPSFNPNNTVG